MADAAQTRPFLPLASGPKNKLRQKVRGGGPKPRESAAAHGQTLLRQIEAFQRTIDDYNAQRAPDLPDLPDEHQLIIEAKRLRPEQVRSLGLTPLEERDEGLLVTVTPDVTLPTLSTKAERYISERTGSGNPRYNGVMAPIDQIRPATRQDKAGERLAALIDSGQLDPARQLWVDIELAGGDSEAGAENRTQFFEYVSRFSADASPYAPETVTATSRYLIETDYSLHRVLLPGRAILDLLDNSQASWILFVELVPEIEERNVPVAAGTGGHLPSLPDLPADAPRIVIIDTGLAADHPLFRDANGRTIIGRQQSFLPDAVDPAHSTADDIGQGHGTAIASLVAYGSIEAVSRSQGETALPVVRLENAKVMVPANQLVPNAGNGPKMHPLQFPKALMRAVVEAFHQPLPGQCKIFVLSVGAGLHPLKAIANWAEEIDNLSARHDLLFVLPTGNLQPQEVASLTATGSGYPEYLLSPAARLRTPGQAYHALTVGAVTPEPAATAPWQRDRTATPVHHPAPFSRSGMLKPGPVKPDVVEVGGNLESKGADLVASPESAVMVANRDFVAGQAEQPYGFQIGTGLAAARVSHLAGRIQAQYPRASANLIRALIVNSAEWPPALVGSFTNDPGQPLPPEARRMMLRLCGYGLPQPEKALSSNTHCMVFVTEDEFSWTSEERTSSSRYPAKVSFFSVQLEPDDWYRLPPATRVRVSITLAYNPPVRKTQRRRYQAVDLRWALRRRHEAQEDFYARWMREANGEDETGAGDSPRHRPEPWPWQLKPVLNPGGRVRRGSLIRDWFDIFAHELPPELEIVTLALVAPWRRPPEPLKQAYALVVSIEALDHDLPIYDSVRVHPLRQPD